MGSTSGHHEQEDDRVDHHSSDDDLEHRRTTQDEQPELGEGGADARQREDVSPPTPGVDRSDREDELTEAVADLPEEVGDAVKAELIGVLAQQGQSWSGALPATADFYGYNDADRERMMSWNDSGTTDESRRQDRLTDATIAQTKTNSRFLRFFMVFAVLASLTSYALFHEVRLAIAVLAFPVLTQFVAVIPDLGQNIGTRKRPDGK